MADEIPWTVDDQLAAVSLDDDGASSSSTLQKEQFSDKFLIRKILGRADGGAGLAGQKVRICGWVKTGREQGKGAFAFLEVNDGSCTSNLQVLVDASLADLSALVATGTSLTVDGCLKTPPQGKGTKQKIELRVEKVIAVGRLPEGKGTKQKIELSVEKVIDVGCLKTPPEGKGTKPAEYPIPKTKLTLEYLRDYPHLRSRTTLNAAVTRIRSGLTIATHTFFGEQNFVNIHTPVITTSDCEGAGEMFQVTTLLNDDSGKLPKKDDGKIDYSKDFFGRPAYLTVSGQLHAETQACALGSVYTIGPTFRAEHSHTSRHLAEFWMVEPELAPADLQDCMNCAEAYVRYMCKWLLEKCRDDMEFMDKNVDKGCIERLKLVDSTPFERITYTEAIKLLEEAVAKGKEFENGVEWGIDLASEHERYLTEVLFKKPVIVYDYPKGIKAFYMRLNDDGKTVAAMDVLVPKVGELIGGSQREERYDFILKRLEEMGRPVDPYKWYLDLRQFGTVKHSGFGLGLERMIMFATGIDNIRDVIAFPRYPGRADL